MSKTISLQALNDAPVAEFVAVLGGIFEHSPWVAERAATKRPFANMAELHATMINEIEEAGLDAQLKLIRAHPELAGKAAVRGELTDESTSEQAGAGLDKCSAEEFAKLTSLNEEYNAKFGFPFILAVRGYDRAGIIAEFERRTALPVEQERAESLKQIYKIGGFRLNDLIVG
ncbi:2-oxo-4-hydroxy-4-carboxy-5-ureidoimidazoline decarboxylase [Crenobacter sp. SG2303]|uniref:2-oxo-4-hydroxy-4-carboxy-5-ureidoimidazoline decarboxylase n=1 Tax=Crenobacter oryzisoli TaxID=3056844 RepID=A0ABT7XJK7_9NEIS|nr:MULTISPECIES: 2-oxo-4-hydroxy-4-carboxy-5-ureidoimidazoline decarboxylase [unclassified Crenobacter]MDN0073960.1 2-oxo-4-hydroxy-4-carboxy-5-ureidoimidazoline decarboxylase [Crenobacter sp. SG2303]MDN0083539.1 2-oxo-4-hydroxy-4-carboxy-5-ureidoimidazoline decarboxylase [Crenobacter sp. SG2305]